MTKKFLSELSKLKDYEIKCLKHHLDVAAMVRDTMTQYGIDEKTMAAKIGIPLKRLPDVLKGAYLVDMRLISKIHAYQEELAYDAAKVRVQKEGIQFAVYQYNLPMLVDKIQVLLDRMDRAMKNELDC